ncbi:hypothetical protein KJ840_04970 [Patescibacteria group bacterium]|nr:hypothetical protein [Patescibacteria group bacterium]
MKKYIIVNFAYGYGPFLRTTELALAVNDLLEKQIGQRFGIIVPWVYGDRQSQIMHEEFAEIIKKYPNEIFLDKKLGSYLESIFYGEKDYQESLKYYLDYYKKIEKDIVLYFSNGLISETFGGKKIIIAKKDIVFAITRSPRINFPIKLAYYSSFAFISEILERALTVDEIIVNKKILKMLIPLYRKIEKKHTLHFIAEPATFSYLKNRSKLFKTEIFTPPNIILPKKVGYGLKIKKGIYVTISGILGLERLFKEVRQIGLPIYTNKPELIRGSEKAPPNIIGSKKILLHFARSGWSSIWLSQLTGVPFIAPAFNKFDDPEIYFNNICIEKLGLGKIYNGQSLFKLLKYANEYKKNVEKHNKSLKNKYGTLDGVKYTADKIVNHFLYNDKNNC